MANRQLPSPNELRQLLDYDPETGELMWRERPREMFPSKRAYSVWNAQCSGKSAFNVVHCKGYKYGRIFDRNFAAHRVIWAMIAGEWPQDQIDHINGDPADNRILNLRACDAKTNSRNTKRNRLNTSGYNGVSWNKLSKKWVAYIKIDGERKHLGLFKHLSDAVSARKLAEQGHGFTDRHGT